MEVYIKSWNIQVQIANINIENGVTVKDVPAGEFIKAFSAYLKKSNKFKIPEVYIIYEIIIVVWVC